jgi:hypothetical protein
MPCWGVSALFLRVHLVYLGGKTSTRSPALGDGYVSFHTLCLIMINFAIQAGGPLSRTGLPVRKKRGQQAAV